MNEETLQAHRKAAEACLEQGRVDQALAHYLQHLQLNPGDTAARERVAELLVRVGKTKDAVRTYEQVARSHTAGGYLFKSVAIANAIQQLDPEHTRTQQHIADAFGRQGAGAHPRDDERRIPTPALGASLGLGIRTPVAVERFPRFTPAEMEVNVSQIVEVLPEPPPLPVDPSRLPLFPLFAQLERDAFVAVLRKVQLRAAREGYVVLKEGDVGTAMFMVAEGRVQVYRTRADGTERVLAELETGSFFGEGALFSDGVRTANVRALKDSLLLELDREAMRGLVAEHPVVGDVLARFHKERTLDNLLRASPFFRPFTPTQQQAIVGAFEMHGVEPGVNIVTQGQPGDGFYVLLRGRCSVVLTPQDGRDRMLPELKEGDVFGEISLLLNKPCSATVRAAVPSVVLKLARADFDRLVLSNPKVKAQVEELSQERRKRTADLLTAIMLGIENYRT